MKEPTLAVAYEVFQLQGGYAKRKVHDWYWDKQVAERAAEELGRYWHTTSIFVIKVKGKWHRVLATPHTISGKSPIDVEESTPTESYQNDRRPNETA